MTAAVTKPDRGSSIIHASAMAGGYMLASFLMGLVGGQRAMTPLATVAVAAARGELSADNGAPGIIANRFVAAGPPGARRRRVRRRQAETAPNRIIPIGLAVRLVTSAVAGAALTSKRRRWAGATIGGVTAVVAAYPGWRLRMATIRLTSRKCSCSAPPSKLFALSGSARLDFAVLAWRQRSTRPASPKRLTWDSASV